MKHAFQARLLSPREDGVGGFTSRGVSPRRAVGERV